MKMKVDRYHIYITPESDTDRAYIEEVLKLRKKGDSVELKRVDAMGLGCIAHLITETKREAEKQ